MNLTSRNKVNAEFNMSSMTDIVFLLLIFFLITSTMISPNGLEVSLPKSPIQIKNKPAVAVTITKDIEFAVNKDKVPFSTLESELKRQLEGIEKPSVSLHADIAVPYGEVIKVIHMCKQNKWRIVAATTP